MARTKEAGKEPKTAITAFNPPDELAEIWTAEVKTAWEAMIPRHQNFLKAYISANYNGAEAYRRTYSRETTSDVARSGASQILTNIHIRTFLLALSNTAAEDLLLVRNTLVEAATEAYKPLVVRTTKPSPDDEDGPEIGEKVLRIPDYPARIKAAAELRDYHRPKGTDAPPPAPAMPTQFVGQFNFYLQQMGMAALQLPIPTEAETVDAEPAESFGESFQQFAKK